MAIEEYQALSELQSGWIRRNLVISRVNTASLKGRCFRLGVAVLQGTGYCQPCSRMEESLGCGGHNAVRHHAGITTIVFSGGLIKIRDLLEFLE